MCVRFRQFWLLLLFLLAFVANTKGSDKLPFRFIENKGQWCSPYLFAAEIPGGAMGLEPGGFRYIFLQQRDGTQHRESLLAGGADEQQLWKGHTVFAEFVGANLKAEASGVSRSSEYYNYFLGDSARWKSNVFGWNGVLYHNLYEGIDLSVYVRDGHIKYDWLVAPSADPAAIAVAYQGADNIFLDNGNLRIATSVGEFMERRPFAYQVIDGRRVERRCEFWLDGSVLRFSFPDGYDTCYPLTIDPMLIFSTFSGSAADNWGSSATPGENGTLYSAGVTNHFVGGAFSGTYPATPGAFQTTYGGNYDIGILKYDSAGTDLLYASYLGGSSSESPHSLVVNLNNDLIVLGTSGSLNFPTTAGVADRSFNGGETVTVLGGPLYANGSDLILSRISADGTRLIASTYVGGTANDGINTATAGLNKNYGDELRGDVITDQDGNVFVATVTSSSNFPNSNSFQTAYRGGVIDGVIFKMSLDLSAIQWGAFIGGAESDACHTVQFDQGGDLFIAGGTNSVNFPVTSGAYQLTLKGDADGWVAKVGADGSQILHATFTGTTSFDQVYFVDLNRDDEIFVYGQTSGNFLVTPGAVSHPNSGQFIQRLNHDLSQVKFSTVFGSGIGLPNISPTAFLVNDCDYVYASGWGGAINSVQRGGWGTNTQGMFTTADAIQRTTTGNDFYFIVMNPQGTEFLYATFFGGPQTPTHVDGGTSRFDKSGVVYHAVCAGCALGGAGSSTSDFPTTSGAWSRTNQSINCNNAAFKFDLSSLRAMIGTNTPTFDQPGVQHVCIPDSVAFENFSIGGEIFEWQFGDGSTMTTLTKEPIFHFYEQPGAYKVKMKAFDQGTCQVVDSTTVTINIHQAQIQIQDDDTLCEGASYQLQAQGGITYSWFTRDGSFQSSAANPTVSPTETTSYRITIVDANGCEKRDSVNIRVVPKSDPVFEYQRSDACYGKPRVTFINKSDSLFADDIQYFDFGDGSTSDEDRVQHRYEQNGVYNVKLVTIRESCVYEKIASIPFFSVYVPNVMTPGIEDLKNDSWKIVLSNEDGSDGHIPSEFGYRTEVVVYSRWGQKVFEDVDYGSDWEAADIAAGIYYFEVKVEEHPGCKGWLHIVK